MHAVKAGRISCYYFFEDAVRDFPDKLAIWSREGEYTWRESNVRVNQYAAFFLELGVRPGQLVAFYLQNSPDFLFAWVGLLATGKHSYRPFLARRLNSFPKDVHLL